MELVLILLWLGFSLAAGLYASRLGRSSVGWALFALILSPLLAFVILFAVGARGGDRAPCPFCAERILLAAKVCPHCQRELSAGWAPTRGDTTGYMVLLPALLGLLG